MNCLNLFRGVSPSHCKIVLDQLCPRCEYQLEGCCLIICFVRIIISTLKISLDSNPLKANTFDYRQMIWLPFYIEIFSCDLCDTRIVANGGQGKPAAYVNHTHLKKVSVTKI